MCAQVWERISRELLAYLDVYSEQRCRLLFCRPPSSRTYFASIEEIIYWLECVTIHACLLGDLLVSFLFDSHFHCCLIAIINKCGTYPIWNRLHKFRHRYLLGKHMKQRGPPPQKKRKVIWTTCCWFTTRAWLELKNYSLNTIVSDFSTAFLHHSLFFCNSETSVTCLYVISVNKTKLMKSLKFRMYKIDKRHHFIRRMFPCSLFSIRIPCQVHVLLST